MSYNKIQKLSIKIINKYANDLYSKDLLDEDLFNYPDKGKNALEQAILNTELPNNFDKTVNHHLKNLTNIFSKDTLHQLRDLAQGDENVWGELGEYYPGWSPKHFAMLLQKLKEHGIK